MWAGGPASSRGVGRALVQRSGAFSCYLGLPLLQAHSLSPSRSAPAPANAETQPRRPAPVNMASRLRRVARHVTGSAVTAPVAFGPPDGPAEGDELALLEEVLEYNTPQITNVVATYPAQKTNLGLYNPWLTNWYCDNTMKCCFPEHGRKCGYAVTCIWGPPRDGFDRVSWIDVLKALEVNRANGRPSALIIKQDFPEEYANKVGLVGGNMANAMKVLGVVGCISDGPIRDLDEVTAFCPLPPPALSRHLSLWPVSSELTRGSVFYRSHTLALSVLSLCVCVCILCLCLYCPQLRELGMHFLRWPPRRWMMAFLAGRFATAPAGASSSRSIRALQSQRWLRISSCPPASCCSRCRSTCLAWRSWARELSGCLPSQRCPS